MNDVSTVVVIGDAHDNPNESKRRFKWLAKFCNDIKPNAIIQIGDVADLDSLCAHVPNDTLAAKHKPSFDQDLVSLNEALRLFKATLNFKPKVMHMTLGNHCERIWRYENENPETFNTMVNRFTDVLESTGWSWTRYGEYYNYKGVDFVHRPLNYMKKPVGGKYVARAVAVDSARDIVFGDTHRFYDCRIGKLGTNGTEKIRAVDVGCAMEWGQIKEYAKMNATSWWHGAVVLTIIDGHIEGVNSVPMLILQDRYGKGK